MSRMRCGGTRPRVVPACPEAFGFKISPQLTPLPGPDFGHPITNKFLTECGAVFRHTGGSVSGVFGSLVRYLYGLNAVSL